MQLDITKESLCINKIVGQKTQNITVEEDMIVPDIKPDILNIINTNGNVCIYKHEVLEGKVRIDGEVQVYIIYLAENEGGETRSLYTSVDFTQVIDFENCNSSMSLDEDISVQNLECKILNERKIAIKANLKFDATLYSNETVDILKQVDNIKDVQSLEQNLTINSLVGEGVTKTFAKDNIAIDNIDNLAEIFKIDFEIKNKDVKISYNKVLAKADMYVKIMYLTEDNRIKLAESNIPIMGFVDVENVTDDDICDMKYKVKNMVTKPNSADEHSIYFEAQIELYARVYKNAEINVISDLYSPTEVLTYNKRNINTMANKNSIKNVCNIKEKISIPEINGNEIYDVEVRPVIIERNITNSKVIYQGELALKFMYSLSQNSGIGIKEINVPFENYVDAEFVASNANVDTQIEVENSNFVIGADGTIDANVDLTFNLNISNTLKLDIIDEVNTDDTRNREIYSMVIYFVKPGDTLWKIAKKFGSTVADIERVNKIEDESKIYPGQQLFIPKYVYTKQEQTA
jgi:LysM repeat protein